MRGWCSILGYITRLILRGMGPEGWSVDWIKSDVWVGITEVLHGHLTNWYETCQMGKLFFVPENW